MNVNYNKAGRACVWAQQGHGEERKGLWLKIPQINTKYFPHKKIKFKEGP